MDKKIKNMHKYKNEKNVKNINGDEMVILLIISILLILILLSITLNIKIEIENLKITLPKEIKKMINEQSKILMKIYILKKIKISEIDLKKIKMNDTKVKNRLDKIKKRIIKDNKNIKFNINAIEVLRENKFKIEKMDLKINIGLEDAAITAITVGIISLLISIILKNKINNLKIQKYQINPIYENKNFLKVEFDGIFEFNIANIIDIIKVLKKGRVNKYDRTSYRRSYAYSNE